MVKPTNGYDTNDVISMLLTGREWRNQKSITTVKMGSGFTVRVINHKRVKLSKDGRNKTYKIRDFAKNAYQLLRKFENNTSRDF